MKQLLLAFLCLISLNSQAQVYNFENEKTFQGNVRMGEEICLNDNPNEKFSFMYLPKVGNTYLSIMMFVFSASDEKVNNFIKYEKKEVHTLKFNLEGGNTICLSSEHWNDNAPLTAVFVDGGCMIINMGFVDAELNGNSFTITSKTKEKEKIKWIKDIKSNLMSNNIISIDIDAKYEEANTKNDVKIHYDITEPTTFIFKSLMFDEK